MSTRKGNCRHFYILCNSEIVIIFTLFGIQLGPGGTGPSKCAMVSWGPETKSKTSLIQNQKQESIFNYISRWFYSYSMATKEIYKYITMSDLINYLPVKGRGEQLHRFILS